MFECGMKESTEHQMEIIDFSYHTVQLAVEFMYGRKLQTLTIDEKMHVLRFFDKYDIQKFKVSILK